MAQGLDLKRAQQLQYLRSMVSIFSLLVQNKRYKSFRYLVSITTYLIVNDFISGNWSPWREPGECSATCGSGEQKRIRTCDDPAPRKGGTDCEGTDYNITQCKIKDCPGEN